MLICLYTFLFFRPASTPSTSPHLNNAKHCKMQHNSSKLFFFSIHAFKHYFFIFIVSSHKRTALNNAAAKGSAVANGGRSVEEKRRLSSSAKEYRNGVDRPINFKETRRIHSKSATPLQGFSRKSPLPGLNGNRAEKRPFDVRDFRRISFQKSLGDSSDASVFSHALPSFENERSFSDDKTFHDALTESVLEVQFSAPSRSTYGLPRPPSPENSNSQERYWTLINDAIESKVVAPLSGECIESTHRLIPVNLRDRFAIILEGITKVFGSLCFLSGILNFIFNQASPLSCSSIRYCVAPLKEINCEPPILIVNMDLDV